MKRLQKSIRRATAMVLAASMILSMLPAAVASEEGLSAQPLNFAEEEHEEEGDDEPVILPLDPEDDGAVTLPDFPDGEGETPTGGGTPMITWPDPNDPGEPEEPDEPESDDPANIPVTLPSFPDEEPDGGKSACADLITEVEDTGTLVITWPDPNDAETQGFTWSGNHYGSCNYKQKVGLEVPATCEEGAYTEYRCTKTGVISGEQCWMTTKKYSANKPALGHSWGEWVKDQKFPCVAGTETRTCSRDSSHTETKDVAPTAAHNYKWTVTKKPSCTDPGEKSEVCSVCGGTTTQSIAALGGEHTWDNGTLDQKFPCVEGTITYKCTREECGAEKTVAAAVSAHTPGEPVVTPATCEKSGSSVTSCSICNMVLENIPIDPLDHVWDEGTTEHEQPCLSGITTYTCTRKGCGKTKTEAAAPLADHTPGTWTDTDGYGCCEQVFTTNCTVCGAAMSKTTPAVREHKFTSVTFSVSMENWSFVTTYYYVCDYCGAKETISDFGEYSKAELADSGSSALASEATKIIQNVLNTTKQDINNAQTREEAIKSLNDLQGNLVAELKELNVTVGDLKISMSEEMAVALLESLGITSILNDVTKEANGSFLSKESLQVIVSKIVDTVVSEDGTAVTKKSLHDVLFGELYSFPEGVPSPDADSALGALIFQLAQTAATDDADWDKLTESLINDLLDEALGLLRSESTSSSIGDSVADTLKDTLPGGLLKLWFSDVAGGATSDIYKAYINSEDFDALFDEAGDIVRKQLVEDPAFMSEVREIVKTAAENAKEGVDKGWSKEKLYANLRSDLSGVSGLVSRQLESLSIDAGDFAEDKVDSTVQDFLLSSKLGSWLGGKLGSAVKDLVNDVIEEESKSLAGTIDDYIRWYTCPKHVPENVLSSEATCTSPATYYSQCSLCGYRDGSTSTDGSALGHIPVTVPGYAATEYADGLTDGSYCERCGEIFAAQTSIPRLEPTIYDCSEHHRAVTEEDALALGYASLDELNAALDAAIREAGFDPANSIRFTAQLDSSIGILPNDRFPVNGVEIALPLPDASAQEYYAVQVFTANVQGTNYHSAGEFLTTPVKKYANTLGLDVYTQAIVIVAWN